MASYRTSEATAVGQDTQQQPMGLSGESLHLEKTQLEPKLQQGEGTMFFTGRR